MAPTTRKLSPETLRRNGIVIEEDISENGWPDEIARIRDRILSFDCIIPPEQVELYALYKFAQNRLEPHLLKSIYKELPQAKQDGWFNGEMACNEESVLGQKEAKERHLENLKAAYNLYEHAVDLERKGGMESKLGDKLADYVFKEWKKHADETSISSAHSRLDGEFATTFGRDSDLFSQAWHVRNDWHSQCSVAEPLREGEMLSIPKPDWYFGFPLHNDIRFPRKTDKGQTQAVFSLTNLNLLEESETLQSCPLMSLNKYCADIKKSPRKIKDHKLTCYPWAVVEAKRPGVSPYEIRKCYYQVANSSSACVALLRGLSDSPAHDYHHPVVALTFVGGNATVFLTYAEPLVGADCDDDDDNDDDNDEEYDDDDEDDDNDEEYDDDEDEEHDDDDDDEPIILYVSVLQSSRRQLNKRPGVAADGSAQLANEMHLGRATGYTVERAATPTHA
ncbi:uncharacterized protein Aud_009947 [Aspergillus udagawae]|uniref:Uncharacterized protein n=1 Tax=Aspergillus udagawae TaxID=91492 RepID=A0A8E0QY58_9EURO|nr:uncharacterized protein Aud_009947 [Aspergillus udagawae]GIC93459.1 hypothetical protein Aud_009947 [Aspergillus udagawae]